ncbi:MAG: hypothetical protein EBV01_04375 [Betaproteobacteria bacterium]|nr:hypothetical protein [Betaproteobacteria bacterium]NBP38058.1 hypothetical protein [Betaproteobacteria bacterium]NBQ78942.1 hypothetical protein [Betaproteobacteria bacterium]NBS39670.1 hypothetical protein [Betaproteobacteria bacterium]NBT80453.1 hypothetical protein [Betaproteobacteria bacterium]
MALPTTVHQWYQRWYQCDRALSMRYPKHGILGALGLSRSSHQRLGDEAQHFPEFDLKSKNNKSLCFFHRHDAKHAEAGHFHVFQYHQPEDVHLLAIALNWRGRPHRLFSVNRWVTGESWMPAAQTWRHFKAWRIRAERKWDDAWRSCQHLDQSAQDLALVGLWLEALIACLEPQMKACLRARDQTLADWIERKPGVNLLEDQALEVLSELVICMDASAASKAR